MSKHSPGPWRWSKDDPDYEDDVLIAADKLAVMTGPGIVDRPKIAANARLIAAAPEMFRLLEWARERAIAGRDLTDAWLSEADTLLAGIDGGDK
jgi:hypothetical protein